MPLCLKFIAFFTGKKQRICRLEYVLEGCHDSGLGAGAGECLHNLAIFENKHGGDGHNAKHLGKSLLLVHIHLGDNKRVFILVGNLVDDGACLLYTSDAADE